MGKIFSIISVRLMVIALLVLLFGACTSTGERITLPVSTDTPLVTAAATTSTTLLPPTATAVSSPTPTLVPVSHPWWNDTVFYEIYVRSFYDSNGDGIGDINGIFEKLDYLNDGDPNTTTDLGITGIWLMPIHPSPSVHGYDVTDFYGVNPQYGTLDDFRRLVDEGHRRGIHIIIDLVLHNTSVKHPWFIQSQDPLSPYRDWYIWADTDPGVLGAWNQKVWYELNGDFYHALFWEGMPDLNSDNPEVTAELEKVTRFWLKEVGIDGFRLDSLGSLMRPGTESVNTQDQHDWFAEYFKFYKQIKPDAMTIGEVWREDADVIPWVTGKQVDLAFEFDLSAAILASVNEGDSTRINSTWVSGTQYFPDGQYGTFLTNHDMPRLMNQLGGNPEKAKAAASVYFSFPGVPFLYYGEEIGMLGEENAQGLMQWSTEPFVGFSSVKPWSGFDTNYATFNVSTETNDPNSLLSHYRTLISLRTSHPALRTGDLFLPSVNHQSLFACLRTSPTESILILVNLSASPIPQPKLSLEASPLLPGEYNPISLVADTPLAVLTVLDKGRISDYIPVSEIPPYATIMLLLQSE
jgi:glycosidase